MSPATTEFPQQPAYFAENAVVFMTQPNPSRRMVGGTRSKAAVASMVLLLTTATSEVEAPEAVTALPGPTSIKIPLPKTVQSAQTGVAETKELLVRRVRELGALNAGWNNPDSSPATQLAVEEAERFIRRLDWNILTAPFISLTDDGEINLVWSDDKRHLDIGFFGDGTYAFYGKDQSGVSYLEDAAAISQALPESVIALITSVTA